MFQLLWDLPTNEAVTFALLSDTIQIRSNGWFTIPMELVMALMTAMMWELEALTIPMIIT
jgi:hypothetical protein